MDPIQVGFIDLFVLAVVTMLNNVHETPPTQKELYWKRGGLINEALEAEHIDPIYAAPLTSNTQLMHSIHVLRNAGLLAKEGSYVPTEAGRKLLLKGRLGPHMNMWPITIDIRPDGDPIMGSANYLPAL